MIRLHVHPSWWTVVTACSLMAFVPSEDPLKASNSGEAHDAGQKQLEDELSPPGSTCRPWSRNWKPSNEEMQALNEEVQAANEELQATNEELEVANEELQSTNEELLTINEEL